MPFPVDDDDASVVFDSRARVLTVVAPVRLYTAARARAHAAFLRRAAREEKRKIKSASSDAASSDSDWVETDGEARQSSDSDSDDALAEDMGAMGLAASPTRARARGARVA